MILELIVIICFLILSLLFAYLIYRYSYCIKPDKNAILIGGYILLMFTTAYLIPLLYGLNEITGFLFIFTVIASLTYLLYMGIIWSKYNEEYYEGRDRCRR